MCTRAPTCVLVSAVPHIHQPALEVWNLGPYQQPSVLQATLMPRGPFQSPTHPRALDLVAFLATVRPIQ